MDRRIQFSQLHTLRKFASDFHAYADAYICVRLENLAKIENIFQGYTHISAMTICVVRTGTFSGNIGLEDFEATKGSLIILNSTQLLNIKDFGTEPIDLDVLFLSPVLLRDINIDPNAINLQALLHYKPTPVYNEIKPLTAQNMEAYFTLLRNNTDGGIDPSFARNIARSLVQCIFYQVFQLHAETRDYSFGAKNPSKGASTNYVHEFMLLLQLHHKHHRTIAFYADKLYISPKYLSFLIKKATGRSAAEWIDQFVINEAKNMLRFSNKNIQQVAIELNFPTQSAFGKYFKHLTGMSPSEYQKT